MLPLHEELKLIRLEKNITLKQVSNKTKIRLDFLERLEEGDYSVVPQPFIRAFFREYAEVIGIDPVRAMEKLDKKIETIIPPKPEVLPVEPEDTIPREEDAPEVSPQKKRRGRRKKKSAKTDGESAEAPETPGDGPMESLF